MICRRPTNHQNESSTLAWSWYCADCIIDVLRRLEGARPPVYLKSPIPRFPDVVSHRNHRARRSISAALGANPWKIGEMLPSHVFSEIHLRTGRGGIAV